MILIANSLDEVQARLAGTLIDLQENWKTKRTTLWRSAKEIIEEDLTSDGKITKLTNSESNYSEDVKNIAEDSKFAYYLRQMYNEGKLEELKLYKEPIMFSESIKEKKDPKDTSSHEKWFSANVYDIGMLSLILNGECPLKLHEKYDSKRKVEAWIYRCHKECVDPVNHKIWSVIKELAKMNS